MIQLSSITNAISNAAYNVTFHTKKLCVESRVGSLFHATIGAVQAHPYIALLGASIGMYCCRGKVKDLVTKVIQAVRFLNEKITESLNKMKSLFRRNLPATEPAIGPSKIDHSNLPTSIPSET